MNNLTITSPIEIQYSSVLLSNSKKNNSRFCIPGLQGNSDILRLRLFCDRESVFVDILVGFPDAASAFISQSLLRDVSETSCSSS